MALADTPAELIIAAQQEDPGAIEELITRVSPDLYRIIFSMLRDHDDTDEVLQETLVRIFRYIRALKEIDRFAAWSMRIAVNQVQTFRVKKGRNRFYEIEEGVEVEETQVIVSGNAPENPRQRLMREQVRKEIDDAIETLPERQRLATVMFEIEGLSIKEIADTLECSEGAVKFNIHEGRKKLKRRLYHLVRNQRWGRKLDSENL